MQSLPCDFFTDAGATIECRNKDAAYWAAVRFLWRKIQERFAKTEASVRGITTAIGDRERQHEYNLIYGDVQSGKSRAIMVIAWFCCFILRDRCPVVLTINLDAVRTDFMKKAGPYGEINSLITEVAKTSEFEAVVRPLLRADKQVTLEQRGGFSGEALSECFGLKPSEFRSMSSIGEERDGVVPVLLQNPFNLRELIKYHQVLSRHDKTIVVIVDEMHKMYTEPMVKRIEGLTHGGANCMSMMYWLFQKCRQLKLHLIGVTATPARAATDIHSYPNQIVKLESDPVTVRGTALKYYGTFDRAQENHIQFQLCGEDADTDDVTDLTVETVRSIISRPACSFELGVDKDGTSMKYLAVKTVLVTVGRLQEDHLSIKEALESDPEIGPLIEAFIVNSDGASCKLTEVFGELERKPLTRKRQTVLTRGAVIIIGQGCFAAGVSVKPTGSQTIECRVKDSIGKVQCFKLFGITDQIYVARNRRGPKTMEQNIQAMRLFGYYPQNYDINLWCTETDLAVLRNQLEINKYLVTKYDKTPESLETMTFDAELPAYQLFDKDPYRTDRATFSIEKTRLKPTTGHEIQTKIYPIGKWMAETKEFVSFKTEELKTLADFYGKDQRLTQHRLHRLVQKVFKSEKNVTDFEERQLGLQRLSSRFQIPYSDARYREIVRMVVHPNDQNTSQVNAFISGPDRENTPLDEIFLVIMSQEWDHKDRQTVDSECYYFQDTPETWIIIHPKDTAIKEHVLLSFMTKSSDGDVPLSEEHQRILDDLEKTEERKDSQKYRHGWNLFVEVYRTLYGKHSQGVYSQKWRSLEPEERQMFTGWLIDYDTTMKATVLKTVKDWFDTMSLEIDVDDADDDIDIGDDDDIVFDDDDADESIEFDCD